MIRGSNRVISNRPPVASFGIHNRFDIEVIDAKTGVLTQEAKAYNVICNQLWTRLFAQTQYFAAIHYGSGEGTPSASDTALFNSVGYLSASDPIASIDYEKGVYSIRKQIQLAAGTAVGVTITEVGIGINGTGSNYLCTHAMLEDMNGNRVSIEKTDTDVINIYATVYLHFNSRGYDGGYIRPVTCVPTIGLFANLCGHALGWPDRMYITRFDTSDVIPQSRGSIPASETNSSKSSDVHVAVTTTVDVDNKTITFTPIRLEANSYNIGGFRYLNLWRYAYGSTSNLYEPYCVLRPGGEWFPGSLITAEAVGTGDGATMDYSLEFPFASDVKVFIDGVETTDFTCDYAPNTTTEFWRYMQELHPDSTRDNHIDVFRTSYGASRPWIRILYNPAHEIGVGSIRRHPFTEVCASDDLINWDVVIPAAAQGSDYVTNTVPAEYANRKYWKTSHDGAVSESGWMLRLHPPASFTGKTLHFNTPPAAGAVITADYKTDTVAKNSNNVFDLSVSIKLGEYSGD